MTAYFDAALIEKYRMSGPRYTSYPTAVQFSDTFTANDHIARLKSSNTSQRDLSLYLHIPFCEHVCYFCGCNKIITRNHKQAADYLDYLEKDIARQAEYIDNERRVIQLHFGGGTPTFISKEEQSALFDVLHKYFRFADDAEGEFSIEIDPRTVNEDYLAHLRTLGFNRVSFGVQDFDPAVQKAVNRVQPYESVAAIMESARKLGYQSISVDLIYGLPLQTADSFAKTVEAMIGLAPDRLAVFNYAHMPDLFGAQKQINAEDLPSPAEKLQILENTITQLTDAGYVFIGLDHFAKPDDSLIHHQKNGTLYRNFQGYSTFSNCDLLGFGISAISQIDNSYSQHHKARDKYYRAIEEGGLPIARGVALTQEDIIRRDIITDIMCNLHLDLSRISQQYQIDAETMFAQEWKDLQILADDGLLTLSGNKMQVEAPGRLLIRNIAMIFDTYLKAEGKRRFSQVI
ncbi:oxygen-independent coproporphyrinogen III oxidase [Suttonella ornithocola]|uniref:Coproporphyrinogen-III oxidase n=1 Tax=Suttonella ornithocola TaxID=279832 RepID=A0A380MMY8_9GAMM|nr:oxygen-independent coproporphyrinogen III oxidase [Suttonella ornithocola]SUO93999.1 Oxygen-independent coproporphyrinogen-III oxidase [Suttonella ornithocola]